jgi:hypothetical protein
MSTNAQRVERAYLKRIAELEAALIVAISWSYGEEVTPERREKVEQILSNTTTKE